MTARNEDDGMVGWFARLVSVRWNVLSAVWISLLSAWKLSSYLALQDYICTIHIPFICRSVSEVPIFEIYYVRSIQSRDTDGQWGFLSGAAGEFKCYVSLSSCKPTFPSERLSETWITWLPLLRSLGRVYKRRERSERRLTQRSEGHYSLWAKCSGVNGFL